MTVGKKIKFSIQEILLCSHNVLRPVFYTNLSCSIIFWHNCVTSGALCNVLEVSHRWIWVCTTKCIVSTDISLRKRANSMMEFSVKTSEYFVTKLVISFTQVIITIKRSFVVGYLVSKACLQSCSEYHFTESSLNEAYCAWTEYRYCGIVCSFKC